MGAFSTERQALPILQNFSTALQKDLPSAAVCMIDVATAPTAGSRLGPRGRDSKTSCNSEGHTDIPFDLGVGQQHVLLRRHAIGQEIIFF